MNKTTKIVGWAILSSALCAPAALGQELRSYSGAFCRAVSPADAGKVSYTQWGVQNDSGSAANVQCGITMQHQQVIDRIGVTVYDRDPNSNICCTFMLQNSDGVPVWTAGNRCSSGNSPNWQAFSAFTPGLPATFGNVACSVPPVTASGLSHVTRYFADDL